MKVWEAIDVLKRMDKNAEVTLGFTDYSRKKDTFTPFNPMPTYPSQPYFIPSQTDKTWPNKPYEVTCGPSAMKVH